MSTEQQETPTDPARPSLKTFKPTAFQLSDFEVVEKSVVIVENFQLEEFTCVQSVAPAFDPMFEVYDGQLEADQSSEEIPSIEDETQPEVVELHVEGEPVQEMELASEPVVVEEGESEGGGDVDTEEESSHTSEHDEVAEVERAATHTEEERKAREEEQARNLEEVRATAREEALAEARAESAEKLGAIEARYATLIDDLGTQIRENIEGVERRAVEFALQIAKKLVGAIVEVNPEYVLGIIQEAVKRTGGATIKAIRVSPQDLEFLKMLSPERQCKEFNGSWSFQADETIHAGCVVETSSGEVEVDLDKAWERIKESVLKVR
jgi:flagellar biosynthesis/type III secretory pathway protein FliH